MKYGKNILIIDFSSDLKLQIMLLPNDDITCPPDLDWDHCKPKTEFAQNAALTCRHRRVMVDVGLGEIQPSRTSQYLISLLQVGLASHDFSGR